MKKGSLEKMREAAEFIRQYDRGMIVLSLVVSLLNSASPYFVTFMFGLIVDWLLQGYSAGSIATLAVCTVLGRTGIEGLHLLLNWFMKRKKFYMEKRYQKDKARAYMAAPYEKLETVEFTDLRQNIRYSDDNMGTFNALIDNFGNFFGKFFTVMIAIFFVAEMLIKIAKTNLDGILPFILFMAITGIVIILFTKLVARLQKRCNAKVEKLYERITSGNRLAIYMAERIVFDYQMGKDLRLYNASSIVEREDRKMSDHMTNVLQRIGLLSGFPIMVSGIGSGLVGSVVYLILAFFAIMGYITVGNVMVYANSIQQLLGVFPALMINIGEFAVLMGRLRFSRELLDMAKEEEEYAVWPEGTEPIQNLEDIAHEVEFRHVSFRYSGSTQDALKDVSFVIRSGEKISVVGANGAGKSTAVKLLCRLYRPQKGKILIDGVDIWEIPEMQYRRLLAVVFQNYKLFSFSLGENLSLQNDYDSELATKVLTKMGFADRLKNAPEGLDTILFQIYEETGMECSGGELQKIAMSRCLYSGARLFVLDEPTSALDAKAEMEIYEGFNQISEGNTTVFISHRLSSCRFSDRILVFENGSIVQNGTHEELLGKKDSLYEKLWNAQAQYYT